MKTVITNIQFDKRNVIRFLNTIFKQIQKSVLFKLDNNLNNQFQKIKQQYIINFEKVSKYKSNQIQLIEEINILRKYFSDIQLECHKTKSELVLTDLYKNLIQYVENKNSDLLKLDL